MVVPASEAPAAPAPVDPNSPAARLQRAVAAAKGGDAAGIEAALEGFLEEDDGHDLAQRLRAGAEWLRASLVATGPAAEQALLRARQQLLAADLDGAMASILESVAADKSFREGLARKAMLLCFAVIGEQDERLDDYRRRLATLLY